MQMLRQISVPILVMVAVAAVVGWTAAAPHRRAMLRADTPEHSPPFAAGLDAVVPRVNQLLDRQWTEAAVVAAEPAEDLAVLRRLFLALFGTIPSLEKVRTFLSDSAPDRLNRWATRMLTDDRFADYFAERLSVAFLGDRANDLPGFRRERFAVWLAEGLRRGRPYDEMAREMITGTGLPTVSGQVNFLTAEIVQGEDYPNRLAGRVARAFLGQRIDCAECHDHPFADWKRADFQGLAAFFGGLRRGTTGVWDNSRRQYVVEDRQTHEKRVVEPEVPFGDEWLTNAARRQRLAEWVTHPENSRFRRAIANRVWGLMFGRPYFQPVDDIPDPPAVGETDETELLDRLGEDFAAHGFDVRRLALVIACSRPFRLASRAPIGNANPVEAGVEQQESQVWARFPLVQLRTEQLGRSMQQVRSLGPLRIGENVLTRTARFHELREFGDEYGTLGERELEIQSGSIQQMLVRMTGRLTRHAVQTRAWWNVTNRIARSTASDAECLEACWLIGLTRFPTAAETEHFLGQLRPARGNERQRIVEDILWAMLNSPEFVWNH